MITAELIEDEKKKELLELHDKAEDLVYALKDMFPGRTIKIGIYDTSEDYWLDGNCYTVNRSFYFPKD